MKNMLENILRSVLIGLAVGVVVMIPVAVLGAVRGGAELALHWSRMVGPVIGAVGLIFAGMRFFSADRDGGQYFRPGRTALELEAEVLDEQRQGSVASEKEGGKGISIWVAIGMVLSSAIPELIVWIK